MQMLLVILNLMRAISTGVNTKDFLAGILLLTKIKTSRMCHPAKKTLFLHIRDMAGALMSLQEGSSCYPGSGTLGANYPLAVTVQDSWK